MFGSKRDDTPAPDSMEIERLRTENQRLHRAVEELSVLNEVALAINSTMAPEQINKLIVGKCMRRLGVQQGAIHLFGDNESDPTKTLMRVVSSGDGLPMRISVQMQGWMHKNRKPLVINDLANDERFGGADAKNLPIKSLLCVPLELKGRLIGLLNLFNKIDGDITPEDARLAAIIASQCSQVIETARLNAEEHKLHALQEDLHHEEQEPRFENGSRRRQQQRVADGARVELLEPKVGEVGSYAEIAGRVLVQRRVAMPGQDVEDHGRRSDGTPDQHPHERSAALHRLAHSMSPRVR
jgi:GAF domain-containing protein